MVLLMPLVFCFMFVVGMPAQPAGDDGFTPPNLNVPDEFSNVVGNYKKLTATVTPTEVFVREPILLRVEITGTGLKRFVPKRRYLRLFPSDVKNNFHIEPLPQKDRHDAKKGTWTFFYQLKPKTAATDQLPPLHLWYFHRDEIFQGYQPLFSAATPLVVKERPKHVSAPQRLYEIKLGQSVLRRSEEGSFPWTLLLTGLAVPPIGCIVWFWLWRTLLPDEAAKAWRRRSRAAQRALKALSRSNRQVNSDQTATVMTSYFHDRLGMTIIEPTPNEVEKHLQLCGMSQVSCSKSVDLFEWFSQANFTPPPRETSQDMRRAAIELIELIEDEST